MMLTGTIACAIANSRGRDDGGQGESVASSLDRSAALRKRATCEQACAWSPVTVVSLRCLAGSMRRHGELQPASFSQWQPSGLNTFEPCAHGVFVPALRPRLWRQSRCADRSFCGSMIALSGGTSNRRAASGLGHFGAP